jgi:hypothetical protein
LRLSSTQAEERRKKRDEIYWSFLDCERRLNSMLALDRRITREQFDTWNSEFDHLFDGVVLFGTPEVTSAAERLAEAAVRNTSLDFLKDHRADPFEEKAYRAYVARLPEIREARSALKAAMQADVGARFRITP